MKIDHFRFGHHPDSVFTIAEIGKNHNGSMDKAKKLIEVAYHAGCHAVKFQAYHTETLLHNYSESGAEPDLSWLKKCELQPVEFIELKNFCDTIGITFLATPESEVWVDVLVNSVQVSAIKVSSLNIDNYRLLDKIAEYDLPVILSTGMSYMEEVDTAASTFLHTDLALLHCVSQYPASTNSLNLNAMAEMKKKFRVPVGFSDHTKGGIGTKLAVAAGAEIAEFHITLANDMEGPDHLFSLNPHQLKSVMSGIYTIQRALGDDIKAPANDEIKGGYAMQKRRCLVTTRTIKAGEVITEDDVTCLCPGDSRFIPASDFYRITNGGYFALTDIFVGAPLRRETIKRKLCLKE